MVFESWSVHLACLLACKRAREALFFYFIQMSIEVSNKYLIMIVQHNFHIEIHIFCYELASDLPNWETDGQTIAAELTKAANHA